MTGSTSSKERKGIVQAAGTPAARNRRRVGISVMVVLVVTLVPACSSNTDADAGPTGGVTPSSTDATPTVTASPDEVVIVDPSAFAAIREEPVPNPLAKELDDVLAQYGDGIGLSATVMSPAGTWSGAFGRANTRRDLRPTDQFAIGSITKAVIAAQVMRLVEEGDVALDDPVADHLPRDLHFDTNGATIRQLLSMTSGIPDYVDPHKPHTPSLWRSIHIDRLRRWTPAELLDLVPSQRTRPGKRFEYASTNYLLLQLMVEHVRGRPMAEVLRADVLSGPGLERMVFQPDEAPRGPVATSNAGRPGLFAEGGGYLPSLAGASAARGAGGIASDSVTLARWWAQFCGGEIVKPATLREMAADPDPDEGYALGLVENTDPGMPPSIGHFGLHVGFSTWASCYADGIVVVALSNHEKADPYRAAVALAAAIRNR